MRRPALRSLRFAFALVSVGPLAVLACSDDGSDPTTASPDAGSNADGADNADAPVSSNDGGDATNDAGATTITVLLKAPHAAIGYAVFYPKGNVGSPVVETFASEQSVTKSMPEGAHVLVAWATQANSGGMVTQVDDVAPGETVEIVEPDNYADPNPLPVGTTIPLFSATPGEFYLYAPCMGGDLLPAGASATSLDHRCIESNGKARFLATAVSSGYQRLATASAVVDVLTDGGETFAPIQSWAVQTPTTWSLTGSAPGAAGYFYDVAATNSTTYGGFELGDYSAEGPPPTPSFVRPPAGFNDGETHLVGVYFPVTSDAGYAMGSSAALLDRTSATAVLSTDLGTLPAHFTSGVTSSDDGISPSFGFSVASAAFPTTTTYFAQATSRVAIDAGTAYLSWLTVTTRAPNDRIAGLRVPEIVRQAITGTARSWTFQSIDALSGLDVSDLRQRPNARSFALLRIGAGDYGLPPGNFQAKLSRVYKNVD